MKSYTYKEIRENPLIIDEFRSSDNFPLRCSHCETTYHKKQKFVKCYALTKTYTTNFCSTLCRSKATTKRTIVTCLTCARSFSKLDKEIAKSKNNFCSQSCSATWNNKNKNHGTRRSKLEVWLEEQLTQLYPDLEIKFNQKDAIGSELDIYIPSLKLAFELNGIFHYEPIYGEDKLQKIQENDKGKFQACIERGISLCIIDISQQSYFKPKTSQRFLDIIVGILDNELSLGISK